MGTKGIYTALSGALAQTQKLDTIANNIANVNTTAFKRDQQIFKEFLTANEKPPEVLQVPVVPASIESFYDLQGGDKSYVDVIGTTTDFSQGPIKPTGNPLDVALDGDGFFEVLRPDGIVYTRSGSLSVDGQGRLVNKEGFPILRQAEPGTDPLERIITSQGGKLDISPNGDVSENAEAIAILSVVDIPDKSALRKMGSGMYTFNPLNPPETIPKDTVQLHTAALEGSNINIISEMTDMIGTTRTFESLQKAISAYDSMTEKLVNVVGRTS